MATQRLFVVYQMGKVASVSIAETLAAIAGAEVQHCHYLAKNTIEASLAKALNPDFSQETHGKSLATATDLEAPFYPLVAPLLRAAWSKRRPLRLVSVRFSTVEEGGGQLEMFAESDEKRRRLAQVLDKLNARGRDATVRRGHQLGR